MGVAIRPSSNYAAEMIFLCKPASRPLFSLLHITAGSTPRATSLFEEAKTKGLVDESVIESVLMVAQRAQNLDLIYSVRPCAFALSQWPSLQGTSARPRPSHS